MRHGPCPEIIGAERLIDVLAYRARIDPDLIGYTFLAGGEAETLSYGRLFDEVCRAAALFRTRAPKAERALLLFGSGLDFIRAFLGCHAAGLVPVPVMPPRDATPAELSRVRSIIEDADTPLIVTSPQLAAMGAPFFPGLEWVTLEALAEVDPMPPVARDDAGDLALIQYTSGSTSAPRGVVVSHTNLLHNLGYIYWGESLPADAVSVSWLPMSHDMGLVEGVLQPLYAGHPVTLMSPLDFLRRPLLWLETISTTGATVSGGPNFAYDLVLRRLGDGPLPKLDLSRWKFAYNGSEPVRSETLSAFAKRLAPVGFDRNALQPLYGMAEATLGITAGRFGQGPRIQQRVSRGVSRSVVSCGFTPQDLDLLVVDPDTLEALGAGEEGEIWMAGPCIAQGYWRQPEKTEATFGARLANGSARYLRTGDLGFVLDGEVFISGRIKEVIISRGQNIHPTDLEHTAEQHPLVRAGGTVAFRVDAADEGAALVLEVTKSVMQAGLPEARLQQVARSVRQSVVRAHGVPVALVAMVAPGTIPRTTSGKRQRAKVAKQWARGKLTALATVAAETGESAWLRTRVETLLGRCDLDMAATLPELGLDSLAALELFAEVQSRMPGLTLAALLGLPLSALESSVGAPTETGIDASLPEDFACGEATELCGTVFVTGGTGFLGGHLILELLARGQNVVGLVRGDPTRLLETLARLPGWDPSWAACVRGVSGDLTKRDLGLSEPGLLATADAVYHCAAMVNWVYPYAALAPSNVGGTLEVLRLASAGRSRVIYLSTMAACWSLTAGAVDEQTDPVDHLDGIHLDYVRTKAVAESLVRQAAAKGLPVSIVRPGLIFSHTKTGQHSTGDFLSALFAGCIEMGCAPNLEWRLDVCPVDEVVTAVLDVAPGQTVHLEAVDRRPFRSVVLWMTLRGYPMRLLPYGEWCAALEEHARHPAAALRPLMPFFTKKVVDGLTVPQLYEEPRRNAISSAPLLMERQTLRAPWLEKTFVGLVNNGTVPASPRAASPVNVPAVVKHSILGELASWRFGRAAGVHRELRDGRSVVVKRHVRDDDTLDIGAAVAALCGDRLATAWQAHRAESEVVRGPQREHAVYADPRLAPFRPQLLHPSSASQELVIEDLDGLPLLDALTSWGAEDIACAVRGIAGVHAVDVDGGWLPPKRDAASLVRQRPLWEALAEYALTRPFGDWLGRRGRARLAYHLDRIEEWGSIRDDLPQTFIHNDFSPRNAVLREDGQLCAYDWELASIGLPQRDLAEFFCFTLTGEDPVALLELHRTELQRITGKHFDASRWRAGFEVALAELLVTRLTMLAMIDAFEPQSYLMRVVQTWRRLDG